MDDPFISEIAQRLSEEIRLSNVPDPVSYYAQALKVTEDPAVGDYALPCFTLAKTLGEKQAERKAPAGIASDLAHRIKPWGNIREVRAVGPYLNFFVDRAKYIAWVLSEAHRRKQKFGHSDLGKGRTVVVEFSSPNLTKPPFFHNLRTTMIGNAIANLHDALGYRVVRITYLGDWGTQFGMLISAFKRWGGEETLKGNAVANLNDLYVRFNREAETEPALREDARAWFKRIEDGDPEAVALWKRFREVCFAPFQEIYRILGVSFDEVSGESLYEKAMPPVVRRLEESGLARLDQGALIVDLSERKMPPVILRKSDGATLYHTRDIAAAEDRWNRLQFHRMFYVVGQEQRLHFRQLFTVLEMMGHPWAKDCRHVDYGMILLKGETGAAKMSTRSGRVILLHEVLDEAVARARKAIEAKNPDLPDKESVARAVGIGAVVFNDLKRQRIKDVDFDWDAILSFEGETGPYVQYAHVRLRGILRKHGRPATDAVDFSLLREPEEFALAKAVAAFGPTLRRAAEACEPALISQYLLDLCSRFSSYYHMHKVLGDDPALTAARILLVDAIRQTIANGLALLGMKAPEEM